MVKSTSSRPSFPRFKSGAGHSVGDGTGGVLSEWYVQQQTLAAELSLSVSKV